MTQSNVLNQHGKPLENEKFFKPQLRHIITSAVFYVYYKVCIENNFTLSQNGLRGKYCIRASSWFMKCFFLVFFKLLVVKYYMTNYLDVIGEITSICC